MTDIKNPGAGGGVAVKPLEWVKSRSCKDDRHADTDLGQYGVGLVHGSYLALRRYIHDGQLHDDVLARGLGFEDAKAVCQGDYEARILAALAPSPSAVVFHDEAARETQQGLRSTDETQVTATPPAPVPSVGEPAGWQRRTRNPDRSWGPWREAGQAEFDGRSTELGVEVGLVEYREVYATPPAPSGEVVEAEIRRAASALLNNLWIGSYTGKLSFEENWAKFEREHPGVKWLHEALKAPALNPAPAEKPAKQED